MLSRDSGVLLQRIYGTLTGRGRRCPAAHHLYEHIRYHLHQFRSPSSPPLSPTPTGLPTPPPPDYARVPSLNSTLCFYAGWVGAVSSYTTSVPARRTRYTPPRLASITPPRAARCSHPALLRMESAGIASGPVDSA